MGSAGPRSRRCAHESTSSSYPFGWLGVLARPPRRRTSSIYAWHRTARARTPCVPEHEAVRRFRSAPTRTSATWPDERIGGVADPAGTDGWSVGEGEIFEKGITPMRSFVAEPMQYGRMYLAGDAARIVPPTGARDSTCAVNDVRLLSDAWSHTTNRVTTSPAGLRPRRAPSHLARAGLLELHDPTAHDLGEAPFQQSLQLARLKYPRTLRGRRPQPGRELRRPSAAPDLCHPWERLPALAQIGPASSAIAAPISFGASGSAAPAAAPTSSNWSDPSTTTRQRRSAERRASHQDPWRDRRRGPSSPSTPHPRSRARPRTAMCGVVGVHGVADQVTTCPRARAVGTRASAAHERRASSGSVACSATAGANAP